MCSLYFYLVQSFAPEDVDSGSVKRRAFTLFAIRPNYKISTLYFIVNSHNYVEDVRHRNNILVTVLNNSHKWKFLILMDMNV